MHLQTFMSLYRSWSAFMIAALKYTYLPQKKFLKTVGTMLRWNFWPKSEVRLMATFSSHSYYLPTRLPCPIAGVLKGQESPFLKTLLFSQENTSLSPRLVSVASVMGSALVVISYIPLTLSGQYDLCEERPRCYHLQGRWEL